MYLLRIVTTVFIALLMFGEIVAIPHTKRATLTFDLVVIATNILALVCMWGIYE